MRYKPTVLTNRHVLASGLVALETYDPVMGCTRYQVLTADERETVLHVSIPVRYDDALEDRFAFVDRVASAVVAAQPRPQEAV